ncbi:hypothetical protein AX17_004376 [Amanita inopinata Kibby_2008]|nr:hypothetical protein AX17_004376 [Amanita inopinata Kibby_2008]
METLVQVAPPPLNTIYSTDIHAEALPPTSTGSAMRNSFTAVLPVAPSLKRKHLRPYSWLPDVFRIKGTILKRIIGPVLTVTLFTTLVAYAWSKGHKVMLSNSIVPMLSVVVSKKLLTRTSYDRYWEGRKSFAQMTSNMRSLARQFWVNVALPPTDDRRPLYAKGKTPLSDLTTPQLRRRKVEALRLCASFVYATKHYLRGEDGVNYADYQDILPPSFAQFDELGYPTSATHSRPHSRLQTYDAIKHSNGSASVSTTNAGSITSTAPADEPTSMNGRLYPDVSTVPRSDATKRVRVKRSKQQLVDQATPLLGDMHRSVEIQSRPIEVSMPLPLVIAHELGRILFSFRREGLLETVGPAGTTTVYDLISGMVDQLTAMERIANTPIPISYGIHLKQCVTLYLFALPLTLVDQLGWGTIPIVTVVAFMFMGIEGIADQIEMPFGTDECDLPLDRFCDDLKEEIFYIINRLPESGEGGYGYDDGEGDD